MRVLHLADDEPAEAARVMEEAARLLGVEPPPAVPFETAWQTISPMARSFWAENRKISSRRTQKMLGLSWRYPTYPGGATRDPGPESMIVGGGTAGDVNHAIQS